MFEDDKDEDPEVVRKQITEQLRAKGVQGEVQVHIDDHDDGKREVRVEVKDERTEHKISQIDKVLDGEIDEFIEAYLLMKANRRAAADTKDKN